MDEVYAIWLVPKNKSISIKRVLKSRRLQTNDKKIKINGFKTLKQMQQLQKKDKLGVGIRMQMTLEKFTGPGGGGNRKKDEASNSKSDG